MGKLFRVVRYVGIAIAAVGAARRGWQMFVDMKRSKEEDARLRALDSAA